MLTTVCPKLPMRHKALTLQYYIKLGFENKADFGNYLILSKDRIEIHFFEFVDLNPLDNYGQIYIRTDNIDNLYQELLKNNIEIHPNGHLKIQPWHQKEFSLLDPDNNLLTFGQNI